MSGVERLISPAKLSLLRSLLREGLTVLELAAQQARHPTVVRRHLRELRLAGFVESSPIPASRGRPEERYRMTQAGREIFFARYDFLLNAVIRAAGRPTSRRDPVGLFNTTAKLVARELGPAKSMPELVRHLQEIGFEPELRSEGNSRLLLSHNCPVLKVAKEHPELTCDAFHCTMLGELLGTTPRPLRQAISRGAEYCVHELEASS